MSKNWEMVGTVGDLSKSDLPETWEFPQNHSQDSGKTVQNPVNFTSISGQNDLKFLNFVSNLLTKSKIVSNLLTISWFWPQNPQFLSNLLRNWPKIWPQGQIFTHFVSNLLTKSEIVSNLLTIS